MKKSSVFFVLMVLWHLNLIAQVSISNEGALPNSSAMLDVQSTAKGFLPPRLTTVQRSAILNPATGLVIFNTDLNCLEFFDFQRFVHNGISMEIR